MRGHDDLFRTPASRRGPFARALLVAGGALLLLSGIALGPVPVVPGFPLAVAGVVLLAGSSERIRRLANAAERRLPTRVRGVLRRAMRTRRSRAEGAPATPPPG
jgi:hypothetical protein